MEKKNVKGELKQFFLRQGGKYQSLMMQNYIYMWLELHIIPVITTKSYHDHFRETIHIHGAQNLKCILQSSLKHRRELFPPPAIRPCTQSAPCLTGHGENKDVKVQVLQQELINFSVCSARLVLSKPVYLPASITATPVVSNLDFIAPFARVP